MSKPAVPPITWSVAGNNSDALDIAWEQLVGFYTPASLVGANFQFKAADKLTGTYKTVRDYTGNALSFAVSANGYCGFTQDQQAKFYGARHLKIVSDGTEAAGTQCQLVTIPRLRT